MIVLLISEILDIIYLYGLEGIGRPNHDLFFIHTV